MIFFKINYKTYALTKMEIELREQSEEQSAVILWFFVRFVYVMEPALYEMIKELATFEKIHVCPFPMCFLVCAPRSKCLSVITDAVKHHRRARHGIIKPKPQRIRFALWPDGSVIRCEIGARESDTGCGKCLSDPKFYGDGYITIEQAFDQGVKAVCDDCYWG